MPITYEKLLSLSASDVPHAYTERDSMLYAVAIGMGRDPMNRSELDFVYERRGTLLTVPTQAVTVARQNLIFDIGLNVEKMLHGEQKLTIHNPLPTAAEILANHKVVAVYDKGPDKGLMIEVESRVRLKDGTPLFDVYNLYFARGDGGIGGTTQPQRPPHKMPDRKPDMIRLTATPASQALMYRLTGDRNVIHADPDIAQAMGFTAPILHGSCTLAIACKEILAGVCEYKPERIKTFGTRFTSIVYPGEQVETQIWVDEGIVSFRCRVLVRDVVVLDHGNCVLTSQ